MSLTTSRKLFENWKRNSVEYLQVLSMLLRETRYLCPKCKVLINLSTAHCSHIISCKTLDKYKAYPLAINTHNLTVCCKSCNLRQSSKNDIELVTEELLQYCEQYNIQLA